MKKILVVLLITLCFVCCKEEPKTAVDDSKITAVESNLIPPVYIKGDATWTLEERMDHYGVPGVSIAVIKDGEIAWSKAYGVMHKERKEPVTAKTLFQAGSISKPVAAYGALRMADQGVLDLEDDINTQLKSWQLPENEFTKQKKVSLQQLLSHTAGLTVHGFLGYSPDLPVPSVIQVLNGTPPANSGPIVVDKLPEESFRYSGGGYTIMQQMVMDASGKSFPETMKELVLDPLGMEHSTYAQPLTGEQLALAATGYLPDGEMTKGERHTYPEMAAAGLWTTSEDLAKFAIDLQETYAGTSTKILSKEMGNKMLTPFVADFIGLGIFINKKKDEIYFGHGGWDEGFSSELVAHRDKGYGVVILTNSNHPDFIAELIRSVALSYEWDDYVLTYDKLALESKTLSEITGRYQVNENLFIEVYEKNGLLYRKGLGFAENELFQVSDTTYVRRENDRLIQFKREAEDGVLNMLVVNPDTGETQSTFPKLAADVKLPLEWVVAGDFDQGLAAYKTLLAQDPQDPTVAVGNINAVGYEYLYGDNMKLAQEVFKINMLLYPENANAYDSYAEACMKLGETTLAIENYKKSLALDPKNTHAEKMISKLEEEN